jgi:cytochrome P450
MFGSLGADLEMATSDIETPRSAPGGLAALLLKPEVLAFAAGAFASFSSWHQKPVRIGNRVIVGRHADAVEVLSRDLEFLIGPVNAAKIDAVNGPFILGMDRDATLVRERALLYRSLSKIDHSSLREQIADKARQFIRAANGDQIDVVNEYARPIAAATAQSIFGIKGSDEKMFMDVARAIFGHVFLNIGNDKDIAERAMRAAPYLRQWLLDEIERRQRAGNLGNDLMGTLLADPAGQGEEGKDLVRRTLGGMLVGSIDTTATCVAKIIAMVGRDKRLAAGMAADIDDFARLHGWCWEALRRWPHNPILLRSAAVETQLSGVDIHVNDQIFIYTQAAMLDASVFPSPAALTPRRPTRSYLHFGGGLHPCAGRDINAFQIPLLVGELVRRGIKSVGAVGWAGPFPDRLPVTFNRMVS